jgi:hypothetical protein
MEISSLENVLSELKFFSQDPEERIQRVMRGLDTLGKAEQAILRMCYMRVKPLLVVFYGRGAAKSTFFGHSSDSFISTLKSMRVHGLISQGF